MRNLQYYTKYIPAFLVLASCIVTVFGWYLLWFFTDDAFISFRYAANWVEGWGPTWNPPPFQPVEGYSNFLWVALLTLLWWLIDLEPPQIANHLLLFFGICTVIVSSHWLYKLINANRWNGFKRYGLFFFTLLLICTHKSFLTWLSSGLETALFTLLMVAWAYLSCCEDGLLEPRRWPAIALLASMLALTRPDGLLFWGLSGLAFLYAAIFLDRTNISNIVWVTVSMGLVIVPIHLIWRRYYYDDWLPNTYYAKVHQAWPEMGAKYLLSYFLEYGLYVPLLVVIGVLFFNRGDVFRRVSPGWCLVVFGLLLQISYYVLVVGGDHFEYRIFHHLAPLTVIFFYALLLKSSLPLRTLIFVAFLWLGAQTAIPWTHWYHSKDLNTRIQTINMTVPIQKSFPAPANRFIAWWDRLQAEMIEHAVGLRHQEHKMFYLFQRATFPPRHLASRSSWSARNILALGSVGVPGWVYSTSAIIDVAGLNDRILAKSSYKLKPEKRQMAHDIIASKQYLDCYQPNIRSTKESIEIYVVDLGYRHLFEDISEGAYDVNPKAKQRASTFSDELIIDCQNYPWSAEELYAKSFYWY